MVNGGRHLFVHGNSQSGLMPRVRVRCIYGVHPMNITFIFSNHVLRCLSMHLASLSLSLSLSLTLLSLYDCVQNTNKQTQSALPILPSITLVTRSSIQRKGQPTYLLLQTPSPSATPQLAHARPNPTRHHCTTVSRPRNRISQQVSIGI